MLALGPEWFGIWGTLFTASKVNLKLSLAYHIFLWLAYPWAERAITDNSIHNHLLIISNLKCIWSNTSNLVPHAKFKRLKRDYTVFPNLCSWNSCKIQSTLLMSKWLILHSSTHLFFWCLDTFFVLGQFLHKCLAYKTSIAETATWSYRGYLRFKKHTRFSFSLFLLLFSKNNKFRG